MRCSQREAKRAVEAGYWHLWRYHPQREAEGKTPFILDSEEPEESFRDFLLGEVRYAALHKTTPDLADALFRQTEDDARARFRQYQRLAGGVGCGLAIHGCCITFSSVSSRPGKRASRSSRRSEIMFSRP